MSIHVFSPSDHNRKEQLMDIVAGVQASRINDQRASFPALAGRPPGDRNSVVSQLLSQTDGGGGGSGQIPDDNFFDQLMRCQVSRIFCSNGDPAMKPFSTAGDYNHSS